MVSKSTAHEQKIIEKLELLLSLIEENFSEVSDEYLIPPDQLEVIDMISRVRRGNLPTRDELIRMNIIWKKNRRIKKYGSIKEFEKSIWVEVDKYINAGETVKATNVLRETIMNEKGEVLGLKEATEMINKRKEELVL